MDLNRPAFLGLFLAATATATLLPSSSSPSLTIFPFPFPASQSVPGPLPINSTYLASLFFGSASPPFPPESAEGGLGTDSIFSNSTRNQRAFIPPFVDDGNRTSTVPLRQAAGRKRTGRERRGSGLIGLLVEEGSEAAMPG